MRCESTKDCSRQPADLLSLGVRGYSGRRMITGIGSLPHLDVAEATSFALAASPTLPAAPSLPGRSPLEGMIAQAAWGINGVTVSPEGMVVLDAAAIDPSQPFTDDAAAEPTGPAFGALEDFLAAAALAGRDRIKLQLTGPVTLGLALVKAGAPASRAFATAGAAVAERAAALLRLAKQQVPAARLVVFLDEPGFVGVGRPRFPLRVEAAIDLVSSALAVLEQGATTGLHCCGAADWGAILRAGPNVLSLPVDLAGSLRPGDVARFLESDGWIAWGAVPTDGPLSGNVGHHWRSLWTCWVGLVEGGVDQWLLHRRAIVTPACGLAKHSVEQAGEVFQLCAEIGARIRETTA